MIIIQTKCFFSFKKKNFPITSCFKSNIVTNSKKQKYFQNLLQQLIRFFPFFSPFSYITFFILSSLHNNNLMDFTLGTWDFKDNLLTSELVVNRLEGFKLVVNDSGVLVVEDNLLEFVATNLVSNTLANNFTWEDKVFKDSVVDSSQSSGLRTLLDWLGVTVWLW